MKSNLVGQQRQARDQKCEGEKHVIIEANLPVWLSRQKSEEIPEKFETWKWPKNFKLCCMCLS